MEDFKSNIKRKPDEAMGIDDCSDCKKKNNVGLVRNEKEGLMFINVPEILAIIFDYLPLEDRKNCKLVSTQWYDILTSAAYQKKEKIMCRQFYSTSEIVSTLMAYRCPLLYHLNLHYINVNEFSADFWKYRGGGIRELNLRFRSNCRLNDTFIVEMVDSCVNLMHLNINDGRIFCISSRVLDILIEKNIVRTNLVSINTRVRTNASDGNQNYLDEAWLIKLFTVFPAIQNFHFCVLQPAKMFFKNLSQSILATISLSISLRDRQMHRLFFEIPSCTTLQHLEFTYFRIDLRKSYAENFLSFLSKQNMLESCTFEYILLPESSEYQIKNFRTKLLNTLFDNCKKLRSLHLSCGSHPDTGMRQTTGDLLLLEKMVKSKLEELCINFELLPLVNSLKGTSVQNNDLKYFDCQCIEDATLFLPIFRGLVFCSLPTSTITNVESVLKVMKQYQTKLVSLTISLTSTRENRDALEDEMSSMFLSLSKLNRLRYLSLRTDILCDILQLNLPNLEYLTVRRILTDDDESLKFIMVVKMAVYLLALLSRKSVENRTTSQFLLQYFYFSHHSNERFLDTIAMCLPNLKFLSIDSLSFPKVMLKKTCTMLRKLQFLKANITAQVSDYEQNLNLKDAEDIFYSSQSLRVLSLKIGAWGKWKWYIRDMSQNRIFHSHSWVGKEEMDFNSTEMNMLGFDSSAIIRV